MWGSDEGQPRCAWAREVKETYRELRRLRHEAYDTRHLQHRARPSVPRLTSGKRDDGETTHLRLEHVDLRRRPPHEGAVLMRRAGVHLPRACAAREALAGEVREHAAV